MLACTALALILQCYLAQPLPGSCLHSPFLARIFLLVAWQCQSWAKWQRPVELLRRSWIGHLHCASECHSARPTGPAVHLARVAFTCSNRALPSLHPSGQGSADPKYGSPELLVCESASVESIFTPRRALTDHVWGRRRRSFPTTQRTI